MNENKLILENIRLKQTKKLVEESSLNNIDEKMVLSGKILINEATSVLGKLLEEFEGFETDHIIDQNQTDPSVPQYQLIPGQDKPDLYNPALHHQPVQTVPNISVQHEPIVPVQSSQPEQSTIEYDPNGQHEKAMRQFLNDTGVVVPPDEQNQRKMHDILRNLKIMK